MAYGSLIEEPGKEILAATEKTLVADVKTPFPVEFARTSSKRAGAPTLIPYKGGERVPARIFVLRPQLSEQEAKDMLWRRETHTEDPTKTYKAPEAPGADDVVVETLHRLYGVHTVLYTRIGANIEPLTPRRLAELAWASACSKAIPAGSDGISYLIEAKRNRIKTPLSKDYETAIMSFAGAESLELAREKAWRTPP